MTKVRIVYKQGTIEASLHENATEVRTYEREKDAIQCVKNYSQLDIVEHVHFVDDDIDE